MLERYKEYKTTNYDWLPRIPSHWEWKYLSQSCNEQKIKNSGNKENCVLSLSYGNIIRKKDINFGLVPKEYSNYQIVNKGNIILRLTDLQNDHTSLRTGLVKEKGIITSAYTCIKPHENPMYLQYLLHSYDTLKVFYGMGGGVRQSIGFKEIRNMNIPLPPRHEQDQIVRYLDWKVSMINKYINAKKKQIELLKEYFSKKVTDLLFKDVTCFFKMKHLTECKLQYGANASGIDFSDKYPRYIRITDINNDGTLSTDNVLSLNISNYNDYLLKDGDILFARSGATVGKSFMYKDEYGKCCFAGYLIRIIPNKKMILPEYLYYYTLSSNYSNWLKHIFIQTTIQNVSAEKYKELLIPYISLEKQTKSVSKIKFKLGKNKTIINNIEKTINLLQEYRTRLISDIVTGKINVQNIKVPEFENIEVPDVLDSGEGEEEGINGDN